MIWDLLHMDLRQVTFRDISKVGGICLLSEFVPLRTENAPCASYLEAYSAPADPGEQVDKCQMAQNTPLPREYFL